MEALKTCKIHKNILIYNTINPYRIWPITKNNFRFSIPDFSSWIIKMNIKRWHLDMTLYSLQSMPHYYLSHPRHTNEGHQIIPTPERRGQSSCEVYIAPNTWSPYWAIKHWGRQESFCLNRGDIVASTKSEVMYAMKYPGFEIPSVTHQILLKAGFIIAAQKNFLILIFLKDLKTGSLGLITLF